MKQKTEEEKKRNLPEMRLHNTSLLTAARLTMIALLSVSFGLTRCSSDGNGGDNCGSGAGTEAEPIVICDYAQLKNMVNGLDKHYTLGQNIDAQASCPGYDGTNGATVTCGAGQDAWAPVGDCGADGICGDDYFTKETDESADNNAFTGSFDGAGFMISNLYYKISASGEQYGGLFGATSGATVRNVGMENVYVNVVSSDSFSEAGGLVGRMFDSSSISNSYAAGGVSASATASFSFAGGLVGRMFDSSSIGNSYAAGGVSATAASGSYASGLVGSMVNSSSISNSYATSSVSATADSGSNSFAGGLVGFMFDSAHISNSYATGDVSASATASNSYAGGLLGSMGSRNHISNSYATGDVSASATASNSYAGGLVGGIFGSSHISNSYATGDVSASASMTSFAGGLVGNFSSGAILGKSYYVAANGIGSGTCTVCSRASGGDDAARRTWLQTNDESNTAMFPTDATGTDHDDDDTTPQHNLVGLG